MRERAFVWLRAVLVVASLSSVWATVPARPAAATDCTDPSDCFTSTQDTIAVTAGISVVVILAFVFQGSGRTTQAVDCSEARAAAAEARKRAKELRAKADAADEAHRKAKAARDAAQRAADAKESWVEDAATGLRWTTDAAKLKRAAEAALTHQVATHQITRDAFESEMARLDTEEAHQELERQATAQREAAQQEAASKLEQLTEDERRAADEMLDADAAADAAEREARDAEARAAAICGGAAAGGAGAAVPGAAAGAKPDGDRPPAAERPGFTDAQREFERLQQALKEEVGNQLNRLDAFNRAYNDAWLRAMGATDGYLHDYLQLLPGIKQLFDAFVDRDTALEMGRAIDEKVHQAIEIIATIDALGAFEIASLEAGGEAALEGGAERAAGAGVKAAEGSAEKALAGGEGALAKVAKPPGAITTGERIAASQGSQAGMTQATSPARTLSDTKLTVAEWEAESKLKDIGKAIQPGKDQCSYGAEAFARSWKSGEQYVVNPASPTTGRYRETLEDLFGGEYQAAGSDPQQAIAQITKYLEDQGPGSQVLVSVRHTPQSTGQYGSLSVEELSMEGHSFNAVNVDGFVKFVDTTKAGLVVDPAKMQGYGGWAFLPLP